MDSSCYYPKGSKGSWRLRSRAYEVFRGCAPAYAHAFRPLELLIKNGTNAMSASPLCGEMVARGLKPCFSYGHGTTMVAHGRPCLPRCLQMPPRCLPDASRCLPGAAQMPPGPDVQDTVWVRSLGSFLIFFTFPAFHFSQPWAFPNDKFYGGF